LRTLSSLNSTVQSPTSDCRQSVVGRVVLSAAGGTGVPRAQAASDSNEIDSRRTIGSVEHRMKMPDLRRPRQLVLTPNARASMCACYRLS
jgi:hypothetical protein